MSQFVLQAVYFEKPTSAPEGNAKHLFVPRVGPEKFLLMPTGSGWICHATSSDNRICYALRQKGFRPVLIPGLGAQLIVELSGSLHDVVHTLPGGTTLNYPTFVYCDGDQTVQYTRGSGNTYTAYGFNGAMQKKELWRHVVPQHLTLDEVDAFLRSL